MIFVNLVHCETMTTIQFENISTLPKMFPHAHLHLLHPHSYPQSEAIADLLSVSIREIILHCLLFCKKLHLFCEDCLVSSQHSFQTYALDEHRKEGIVPPLLQEAWRTSVICLFVCLSTIPSF